MGAIGARESIGNRYFKSFLYGGCSALLISAAHYQPEYWFVSLFALVPFLWRVTRVRLVDSLILGATFATSYCFIMSGVSIQHAPGIFLLKLLILNVLFVFYASVINRIAKRAGYNAIIIAIFWLPVEYTLIHYAYMGGILSFSNTSSVFFIRIGSLLGALSISFLIVLVNSLILLVSECLVRTLGHKSPFVGVSDKKKVCRRTFESFVSVSCLYHFLAPRAPPAIQP